VLNEFNIERSNPGYDGYSTCYHFDSNEDQMTVKEISIGCLIPTFVIVLALILARSIMYFLKQ